MSRRSKRVAAGLAALLSLVVALVVLRATVLAPRYDVPSIAAAPAFKDPALLDHAWAKPVAAAYGRRVAWQSNPTVCGPSSIANVMRSTGDAEATQQTVLSGTGRCRTGVCFGGLTLDELAEIARAKTGRKVTIHRDLGLDAFRELLRRSNDPGRRLTINFHRGLLFGKGGGHHSPIGAYLEEEDLVFVLDVNESFGPWLVSTARLHRAMDTVDDSSGKKRGVLEIE